MKMKNQKGFSLIELLIVVVIIGIIAAIAIPNLLASRRAANEGAAQSTLRTIHSAEATYFATAGAGTYGDLADLGGAQLIDQTLSAEDSVKSGYKYNAVNVATSGGGFAVSAVPTAGDGVTATGTRDFCVATDGVLTYYTTVAAPVSRAETDGTCIAGGTPVGGVAPVAPNN